MASCGTPAAPSSSLTFWSVIRLLLRSSDSYARGLPRCGSRDSTARVGCRSWPADSAEKRAIDVPMIVVSTMWSRLPSCMGHSPLADAHAACRRSRRPAAPMPPHLPLELNPRVVPASWTSSVYPETSALPAPQRVWPTVSQSSWRRRDRDPERETGRHPAAHDQLGKILPGQVGGEGALRRAARRARAPRSRSP